MRQFANRGVATILALALVGGAAVGNAAHSAGSGKVPDFTRIVKQNRDAVVNVSTTQKVSAEASGIPREFLEQLPPGHPLKRFFKRFGGGGGGQSPQRERTSLGSGFIISSDGYVLTNAHVVAKADQITVQLHDNRQFEAKVVGMDKPTDVGLLKVDAKNLPTVDIGNSDKLQVGQWLLAIGSPFGLDYTATQGIVSALERSLPNDTYTPFIQTDVAVNPGNSGGPLFNGNGEVIGINSQIFSRTGGYMGLSFAVPINTAMHIVAQLKEDGTVERGYLGVSIQPVDRGLAESFGLDKPVGALVANVVPDSPAAAAGLKAGDVILRFGGKQVSEAGSLPPMVGRVEPGESVDVQIVREGERQTLTVEVGKRSDFEQQSGQARSGSGGQSPASLNAKVRELSADERKKLGLEDRGLLVETVGRGPLAMAGVRPGDVLLQIGGTQLESVDQLRQAVKELPRGEPVPLQVRRGERTLFVSVTIPEGGS